MDKNKKGLVRTSANAGVSLRRRRGFTLIELLVVIAIIGIVSSIVLAFLGGARDSARDARLKSHMDTFRKEIELKHNFSGNYGFDCPGQPGASYYPSVGNEILKDAKSFDCQQSIVPVTSYAISAQLNKDDSWFCVDSSGYAGSGEISLTLPPRCTPN